jgi:hypothetical protein
MTADDEAAAEIAAEADLDVTEAAAVDSVAATEADLDETVAATEIADHDEMQLLLVLPEMVE